MMEREKADARRASTQASAGGSDTITLDPHTPARVSCAAWPEPSQSISAHERDANRKHRRLTR
jgi:hypothetical protein